MKGTSVERHLPGARERRAGPGLDAIVTTQFTTAANQGRGGLWVANALAANSAESITVNWPSDVSSGTVIVC